MCIDKLPLLLRKKRHCVVSCLIDQEKICLSGKVKDETLQSREDKCFFSLILWEHNENLFQNFAYMFNRHFAAETVENNNIIDKLWINNNTVHNPADRT